MEASEEIKKIEMIKKDVNFKKYMIINSKE